MKTRIFFLFISFCMALTVANAQEPENELPAYAEASYNDIPTYRIGFFAPLYLDSAFSGTHYRYEKNFPRFAFPGLEFFQGARVALDSMLVFRANVEAYFYDTQSGSLDSLLATPGADSLNLLIGSVREQDFLQLADHAARRNIPFISATYPNDGGASGNPFLVIMNSTLRAHCEAIFSYVLQAHSSNNVMLISREGIQEHRVKDYIDAANMPDNQRLLNFKTLMISDGFDVIEPWLDSTRENVLIGGSLDETFAKGLAEYAAAHSPRYKIRLIGMPNWDGYFRKANTKLNGFPVYFTNPFYTDREDAYSQMLQEAYVTRYNIYPSELAYKGFETVYLFVKLLAKHPHDFITHLNNYPHKVFADYNFKPVFINDGPTPDYFENKHLYFLKALDGKIMLSDE